jgi:hypothetical protein
VVGFPAAISFFSIQFALQLHSTLSANNPLSPLERLQLIQRLRCLGFPWDMTNSDKRMARLLEEDAYRGRVRLAHYETTLPLLPAAAAA